MQYEDESRRINMLSGLLIGVLLGTGLTLLLRPQPVRRSFPSIRARIGRGGS